MKAEHRHELETNVLAHGLEAYIERIRPYFGTIIGSILAVIALMFVWSYLSGSTDARSSSAWDAFNLAIGSAPPNLDVLRQTAQENEGTAMQRLADVTWADGQVYIATQAYLTNRKTADEALNKAASAYQAVIQTSDDPQITGRARLGLGRIYEMQNELEKARQQYEQVTGAFAAFAKAQAERLAKPEAQEAYAWLATAQAPISRPPMGPGTPGQSPEFTPGEIGLPNATDATSTSGKSATAPSATESFEKMLKDMQKDAKAGEAGDRYKSEAPAGGDKPAAGGDANQPAESKDAPPPAKSEAPGAEESKQDAPKSDAPAAPAPPAEEKK